MFHYIITGDWTSEGSISRNFFSISTKTRLKFQSWRCVENACIAVTNDRVVSYFVERVILPEVVVCVVFRDFVKYYSDVQSGNVIERQIHSQVSVEHIQICS